MKRALIILILLGLNSQAVRAQMDSAIAQKRIKLQCLQILDKLQENSRAKDNIEIYRFKKLFASDSVEIVNEVLPTNRTNEQITIAEYLDLMYQFEMGGTFIVYSMRPYDMKVSPGSNAGIYEVQVDMKKVIGLLSTDNIFYRDTIDINYQLRYNELESSFQIIEASLNSAAGYFMVLKVSEGLQKDQGFDGNLLVNGAERKITDGYLVLNGLKPGTWLKVSPSSQDYLGKDHWLISPSAMDANGRYQGEKVILDYRPKAFFMEIQGGMGTITDNVNLINTEGSFPAAGSLDLIELNLNIGYRFFNSSRWAGDILLSAGTQRLEGTYQLAQYQSEYLADEGETWEYEHETIIEGLEENNEISTITFGVGAQLHNKIASRIKLNLRLDYKSVNINEASYLAKAEQISHRGIYDVVDLWTGTISENKELGFGEETASETQADLNISGGATMIRYGAGVDYALSKRIHLLLAYYFNTQTVPMSKDIKSIKETMNAEHESIHYQRDDEVWNFAIGSLSIRYFL